MLKNTSTFSTATFNFSPKNRRNWQTIRLFSSKQKTVTKSSRFNQFLSLFRNLFETYLPVSFYLLMSSMISLLFGQMVGWFLCFVLTRFSAALMSSLIFPHLIIKYIPNVKCSEKDRRMVSRSGSQRSMFQHCFGFQLMLFATIVESLAMDFVWPGYGCRFVSPPMFLFCLGSMIFFHSKTHGRPNATFLAVIIGVPVYFYAFIYARLVASTFGRLYHIWLFMIGGAAIMDIKVKRHFAISSANKFVLFISF